MERFFINKKIWKKIVVAILVIMAFHFIANVPIVRAVEEDAAFEGDNTLWGGILLRPILSLIVTVDDGIINLLHTHIMSQETSLVTIEGADWWQKVGAIILAVLAAVAIAAAIIYAGYLVAMSGALANFATFIGASSASLKLGVLITSVISGAQGAIIVGSIVGTNLMPSSFKLPVYSYSPEEIFKGNILMFDVNFFNPITDDEIFVNYSQWIPPESGNRSYGADNPDYGIGRNDEDYWVEQGDISKKEYEEKIKTESTNKFRSNYYYYTNENGEQIKTSPNVPARDLHNIIATWYIIIRNICIVLMLSILIYIGIRMMLTSIASDKAKYKEMLKDWITGLCLLFLMHYIMTFSVTIIDKITDVVDTSMNKKAIAVTLPDNYDGNLIKAAQSLNISEELVQDDLDGDGKKELIYPTNLMGKVRILLQLNDKAVTGNYIGYIICFTMLVVLTVIFTFTYLKRLLYMTFLTLISPLVAMTYCIDKINDGQAQGFNIWIKEYIFNLLLQPMHLLLYYILVTSAFELSSTNIIYSIVALSFLVPAEKILRGMFGFEKAKTPPSFVTTATGLAMATGALNRLRGGHGGGREGRRNNQLGDDEQSNNKDLSKPHNPIMDILGGGESEQDEGSSGELGMSVPGNESLVDRATQWMDNNNRNAVSREVQFSEEFADRQVGNESFDNWFRREHPDLAAEDDKRFNDEMNRQQQLTEEFYDTGLDASEYDDWYKNAHPDWYIQEHPELSESQQEDNREQIPDSQGTGTSGNTRNVTRQIDPGVMARIREAARETKSNATKPFKEITSGFSRVVPANEETRNFMKRARNVGRVIAPKLMPAAIRGAKTLVKASAGVGGAIVGGSIAAATTGDLGKAVQGAATGATAGTGIATGAMNVTRNAASGTAELARDVRDAWHEDDTEWKEEQREKLVSRRMKDSELRRKIRAKIGDDGLQEMEDSGRLKKYIERGVEKPEEMVGLQQFERTTNVTTDQALGVWQLRRDMAGGRNTNNITDKGKLGNAIEARFAKERPEAEAKRLADKTIGWMDSLSEIITNV